MCGIVYCKDFRGMNVSDRIVHLYKNQRSRGRSGFGFFLPQENVMYHNPDERPTMKRMKRIRSSEILFHHRMPTSTANIRKGCHPYSTKANKSLFKHQYVMVHNGVLTNDFSLRSAHEALGIKYVSKHTNSAGIVKFNDSEALLYDLALFLEGKQDEIKAYGSIAFIVAELNNRGRTIKLHFGRNDRNPLKMNFKPGQLLHLSSQGKGESIETDTLYTFNYDSGRLTKRSVKFPTTFTSHTPTTQEWGYGRGNYNPHASYNNFPQRPSQSRIEEAIEEANKTIDRGAKGSGTSPILLLPEKGEKALNGIHQLDEFVADAAFHKPDGSGFYDGDGVFYSWEDYAEMVVEEYEGGTLNDTAIEDYLESVLSITDRNYSLAVKTTQMQLKAVEDKLEKKYIAMTHHDNGDEIMATADYAKLLREINELEDQCAVIEIVQDEIKDRYLKGGKDASQELQNQS